MKLKNLFYLLAFVFMTGCATTPQQIATAEIGLTVAETSLNIAYDAGKLSQADHDKIKPFVDAADDALASLVKDSADGNKTNVQKDLDALNAALPNIVKAASAVSK